jgi:glutathione peroxidase
MFSKIAVKGKDIDPLYALLTSKDDNPRFSGSIKGNFSKFLVDRKGAIIGRFESADDPLGDKVPKAVEAALGL